MFTPDFTMSIDKKSRTFEHDLLFCGIFQSSIKHEIIATIMVYKCWDLILVDFTSLSFTWNTSKPIKLDKLNSYFLVWLTIMLYFL